MMLASAVLLTLTPSVFAVPQGPASPAPTSASTQPYWAVITNNAVNVRSGPSAQSAYAFGKLNQGDVVRVVQEEYGWAKIQTTGNAFAGLWAYVPADRRVTLSADKSTAQVTARTEVRAPNTDAGGSPDKSWKQIGRVEAGTTLTVLGTVEGEKDSVYKVRLPESSEGWVNKSFLRTASESEAAGAVASANAVTPASTPVAAAPAPSQPAAAPVSTAVPANAPAAGAPTTTTTVTTGTATVDPALNSPAIPPLMGQPVAITTTTTATTTEGPGNGGTGAGTPGTTASGTSTTTVAQNGGTTSVTTTTTARRTTIADLETQFDAVKPHPEATEELNDLLRKYEEFVATPGEGDSSVRRAKARIEQLRIITETNTQTETIKRTQKALTENKDEIAKLILDMQRRADYTAIGVLNASAVYDGEKLPELYRVCDPMTSATIAYVTPNPDIPMSTMLGTLVGVKGGKDFDPALRLNVINPMVIELLTTRETPQVAKSDETKPIAEAGKVTPATVKTAEPAKPAEPAKATEPAKDAQPPAAAPVPPGQAPAPEK